MSESFSGTLSSIYIDESLVFVTRLNSSETGVERFLYKNGNLEAPSHLEKLSDKKVMVNDGTSFNVLSMIYSYNPYHGKVVEAGTVQNIINIYSLDGVFKKSVRIGKPSEFDIKDRMTWPMSYEHMDLYDEFIAALFVDDTSYNHSLKAEVLPVIRILDWEGTPLLELKLDKHATNFEFDFKNMKLYTLNSNDESFYEYDVSSLYLKYPQIFKNE